MSDTPRTDNARAEYQKLIWTNKATTTHCTVGIHFARELERENNELRELVRLLTIEEVSDSGRTFCPTEIHSCRCMDLEKIHTILQKYK